MTLSEILELIVAFIVLYSAILLGTRYTAIGSKWFDFNRAYFIAVAARLALVHVLVAFLCCIVGNLSPGELIIVLITYLISVFVAQWLLQNADAWAHNELGLAPLAVMVKITVPAMIIGYFVLLPARRPSEYAPETSQLSFPPLPISDAQLEDQAVAIVVSPLKPFGYIELDGKRLAANCLDGGFVQAGVKVQLHSRAGQTVIVKRIATDT